MKSLPSRHPEQGPGRRACLTTAATLPLLLVSPRAFSNPGAGDDELTVAGVRTLSAALANEGEMDADTAKAYLAAMRNAGIEKDIIRLVDLVKSTSPGQRDQAIAANGLDNVANTVVATLYSGMTGTGANPRVITYSDALAWRALPFTKPNGQCGGEFGYWSQPPA